METKSKSFAYMGINFKIEVANEDHGITVRVDKDDKIHMHYLAVPRDVFDRIKADFDEVAGLAIAGFENIIKN